MNEFDAGFVDSDEEEMKVMAEPIVLKNATVTLNDVRAVVNSAGSLGSVQRPGGTVPSGTIEVTVLKAIVTANGIDSDWRVIWEHIEWRVSTNVNEGGTVTLVCNVRGDARDG